MDYQILMDGIKRKVILLKKELMKVNDRETLKKSFDKIDILNSTANGDIFFHKKEKD